MTNRTHSGCGRPRGGATRSVVEGAQDPQVAAATLLVHGRADRHRDGARRRPSRLADRVGQGLEVVGVGQQRVGVGREAYDLPAAGAVSRSLWAWQRS